MFFGRFIRENPDQRRRRLAVLVMYLFMALFLGAFTGFSTLENIPGVWRWLMAACSIVLLLQLGSAFYALRDVTGDVANQRGNDLDEREHAIRDRAYYRAYKILSSIALCVLFYYVIALDSNVLPLRVPQAEGSRMAVFLCAFLLVTTLPTAILAWDEPDLEEENA